VTPPFVRIDRSYWRVLAPRWAHRPLGGEGAAKRGGRWNAPGQAALYMSEDFSTAVAEYQQELGMRPGTLCAYAVVADAVVDLCDPAVRQGLALGGDVFRVPWKRIAFVEGGRPPTWGLARRLTALGAAGARVPSAQARSGVNLVLWRWNLDAACRVEALDPLGDLPRDQRSWEA